MALQSGKRRMGGPVFSGKTHPYSSYRGRVITSLIYRMARVHRCAIRNSFGNRFMLRTHHGVSPRVHASCYVDESAQIIGEVILEENSSVWMNAVLRGDVSSIRVGANSNVQDCCVLHGMRGQCDVVVGDWVTVGHS